MKRQLKRMVPGRPHRPASVRWSTFLGWHRRAWQCGTVPEWCLTGRPSGARGKRHPLPVLP